MSAVIQQAAQPKERPIIFGSESVRAILDGRKTMTRRVVKGLPQNIKCASAIPESGWLYRFTDFDKHIDLRCPYGRPWPYRDRLWVREAWAKDSMLPNGVRYYATDDVHELRRKRSPIHMPRWASRITLDITAVHVERLHEITEADAKAEGAKIRDVLYADEPQSAYSYREQFMLGWDQLNAKRGYPWKSNPFVWVITFKRINP